MTEKRKYKCPYCPKEYQSQKELNKHIRWIHGKVPPVIRPLTIGDVIGEKQFEELGNEGG
jgi:uncharacterized C2H2 Zn-finger protein